MGRRCKKQIMTILGKPPQRTKSVNASAPSMRKQPTPVLAPPSTCSINGSVSARNLPQKQLGGVIFGCTHQTIKECLQEELFGLPASHFPYVKKITPGLPIFLFNYSDRRLHGIYVAITSGQMNINPHGWIEDGSVKTPYPAQIRVKTRQYCESLTEDKFKGIIKSNYTDSTHIWFELDQLQTGRLIALFKTVRIKHTTSANLRDIPIPKPLPFLPPCSDMRSRNQDAEMSSIVDFRSSDDFWYPHTDLKWADLFKADSKHDSRVGVMSISASNVSGFDDSITEPGSTSDTLFLDADRNSLEPKWLAELVTEENENEEEQAFAKLKQIKQSVNGSSQSCRRSLYQTEDISTPENWEEGCYSDALDASTKYTDDSAHLFGHQSSTYLVRQELDAVMALLLEQVSRTAVLEKKQAESDALLQVFQVESIRQHEAYQAESFTRYEKFQAESRMSRKVFHAETSAIREAFLAESDTQFKKFQAESDARLEAFEANSSALLKQLKDRYEKKTADVKFLFAKEVEELKERVEILEFLLSKSPVMEKGTEEEPEDRIILQTLPNRLRTHQARKRRDDV